MLISLPWTVCCAAGFKKISLSVADDWKQRLIRIITSEVFRGRFIPQFLPMADGVGGIQ
jgi:hypothetical protein